MRSIVAGAKLRGSSRFPLALRADRTQRLAVPELNYINVKHCQWDALLAPPLFNLNFIVIAVLFQKLNSEM